MTTNCSGGAFTGSRLVLDGSAFTHCSFDDCDLIILGNDLPRTFAFNAIGRVRWAIAGPAKAACLALHAGLSSDQPEIREKVEELLRTIQRDGDIPSAQRACGFEPLLNDAVTIVLTWIRNWVLMGGGFGTAFISALRTGQLDHYLSDVEPPATDPFARPNEHQIYDPRWAQHDALRVYSGPLRLLENAVRYAADILLEAFAATPDSPGTRVAIGCLFRQAVAAADSVYLHLSHGASYMARLPARALLEASLLLEFIVANDTEALGKRYFVAALRRYRRFLLQMREGTIVQGHHAREHRRQYGIGSPLAESVPTDIDEQLAAIERDLRVDDLPLIDQELERLRGTREQEPEWWFADSAADRASLAAIARRLNRWSEYVLYYETMSDAVHGRAYERHILHHGDRGIAVEFIRHSSDFVPVCQATIEWLASSTVATATKFLPARRDEIVAEVERWRRTLVFPSVKDVDATPAPVPNADLGSQSSGRSGAIEPIAAPSRA